MFREPVFEDIIGFQDWKGVQRPKILEMIILEERSSKEPFPLEYRVFHLGSLRKKKHISLLRWLLGPYSLSKSILLESLKILTSTRDPKSDGCYKSLLIQAS